MHMTSYETVLGDMRTNANESCFSQASSDLDSSVLVYATMCNVFLSELLPAWSSHKYMTRLSGVLCNASPLTFTLHLQNGAWGGWRDGCHPCCGCRTHGSETQFAQWVCRDLKSSQVSSCGHALVMNPNEMLKACRRLAFSSSDHPGPRWAPTSGLHHRRLWRGVTCFVLLRKRFAMMVPLDKIVWSLQRLRCFLRAPNCTFWHILTSTCILTSRSAQRRKAELTSTPSHLTGNGYSTRRRW